MKLENALKKHKGERVKIGAQSSYIFCGTLDDKVYAVFEGHDKVQVRRLQKIYNEAQRHDENFETIWNEKTEKELKNFNACAVKYKWTMDMIAKKHKDLMHRIDQRKKNDRLRVDRLLRILPQNIDNYVPIRERKVKEIYPSLEGGTVIIFEGLENGSYWTYAEYEEKNR